MSTVDMEAEAVRIRATIKFLYGEVTIQDDTTIKAMLVLGGTTDQITRALGIAAVNSQVGREDKSRYAYGCLRNIMIEDKEGSPREKVSQPLEAVPA